MLPSIALCLLESVVLFGGEGDGLVFIFAADPEQIRNTSFLWGWFNEASRLGMIRSLLFVGAVALLLGRHAWLHFRYRVSFLTFCVAMTEALFIVESGERAGYGNLWWGPFVCYWVFLLESFAAFLREALAWMEGQRANLLGVRLVICGIALLWQAISGVCFLILLLQGNPYNIAIANWF